MKEKRLDAGDVILFERHRTDSERLFIGWRRRGATAVAQVAQAGGAAAGGCGWPRGLYPNHPYPVDVAHGHGVSAPLYQHAGIYFVHIITFWSLALLFNFESTTVYKKRKKTNLTQFYCKFCGGINQQFMYILPLED